METCRYLMKIYSGKYIILEKVVQNTETKNLCLVLAKFCKLAVEMLILFWHPLSAAVLHAIGLYRLCIITSEIQFLGR